MRSRAGVWSVVLIVVATIFPSIALAEPIFSVKGGAAWSWLRGDDVQRFGLVDDSDRRLGLVFGAGVELPVGDALSLQPELLYVQRGESYVRPVVQPVLIPDDFATDTLDVRASYLDIPVLLRLRPFGRDGVSPSFYAGPTVSVLLDAEYVVHVGDQEQSFDADSEFEDLGFGVTMGAGLDFGPRRAFLLDARYVHGLGDANAHGQAQRWGAGMLLAGFRF